MAMIIRNGEVFTLKNGGSFEPLTIKTDVEWIQTLVQTDAQAGTDVPSTEPTPVSFISGSPDTPDRSTPSPESEIVIDATDCYVIPGLVDVHFHGCGGYDFCDGTPEALDAICDYELRNGITDICPTTMTLGKDVLCKVLENVVSYKSNRDAVFMDNQGANLIGIHMEGPFISPAKKGAQNAEHVVPPTKELLDSFLEKAGGLLRLLTIAPEMDGAIELIEKYKDKLAFSVGHSEADYQTAKAAMEAGALHVTHLYNAMPPLTHRAPGIIGAAADTDGCMVELICDGVHIEPAVIRATFKLFGADNIILISDSTAATGMPDGKYSLGDLPIIVNGNRAELARDRNTIAGSVTNLYDCMLHAVKVGIPLSDAIKAATINPSRSIGMDALLGSVEVGKKAHLLLIDKKDLTLKAVIKGTQIIDVAN